MNILFLGYDTFDTELIEYLEADGNIVKHIPAHLKIYPSDIVDIDLIISYGYKCIIKKDIINKFKNKIINLHISLLPRNRGMYPNLWSALEDTISGVSIHYIDEGIDTGDILTQRLGGKFMPSDTLKTSYMRLRHLLEWHFMFKWHDIKAGKVKSRKQDERYSSYHTKQEGEALFHLLGDEFWDCKVSTLRERAKNDKK